MLSTPVSLRPIYRLSSWRGRVRVWKGGSGIANQIGRACFWTQWHLLRSDSLVGIWIEAAMSTRSPEADNSLR